MYKYVYIIYIQKPKLRNKGLRKLKKKNQKWKTKILIEN